MQVGVEVTLQGEVLHDPLGAPRRPVVGGERDLGLGAEQVDRLGQVAGPGVRVAHQRATQRQQVVQGVRGVLRHAQRLEVREVEVHLGRRLGPGGHLEDDAHPVDDLLLAGRGDLERRRDQGHRTGRGGLAEPGADLPARSTVQRRAVHVAGAAAHRRTGVDVLGDGVLDEAGRGDHDDGAGVDLLLGGDALDAAEVVDVGVGVDHRGDRPVAAVLPVERQRGGRGLRRDERVDDDHSGLALDERDVREVEPAHLVDPLDHLEQALQGDEPRLAPQAGMRGVGRLSGEERVGVVVPDDATVGRADHARLQRGDQAPRRIVEVPGVRERQGSGGHLLLLDDPGRGWFRWARHASSLAAIPGTGIDRTG